MDENIKIELKLKFKKYLPEKVTNDQLEKLNKVLVKINKADEEKVLKQELQRIILNDELNTASFLINVPDKINDLTKLPKRTKESLRERIIDGILNINNHNYLNYSPLGLQQYVGVSMSQLKKWLEEEEKDIDEKNTDLLKKHKIIDLYKMLKYKFEFNHGKTIITENMKNLSMNPNMLDFDLGVNLLSADKTWEDNEIPFDTLTQDKPKDSENEWKEYEKEKKEKKEKINGTQ